MHLGLRCAVIAMALAACRNKSLDELRVVRDEVCACKTTACGEEALKRVPQGDVKADHRMQELANEMLSCMAKLYLRDRPSTDPDAPSAPGSADPASARTP